jgi:hypothetical protein
VVVDEMIPVIPWAIPVLAWGSLIMDIIPGIEVA